MFKKNNLWWCITGVTCSRSVSSLYTVWVNGWIWASDMVVNGLIWGLSPFGVLELAQPVESVDCLPVDGKLMVKWKIHKNLKRRPSRFVIEWVSISDGKGDWQQVPREARNTTLKGGSGCFALSGMECLPGLLGLFRCSIWPWLL